MSCTSPLPYLPRLLLLLSASVLASCATTTPPPASALASTPYDGQWEIISQPVSALGADDSRCGALYGNLSIQGGRIIGDIAKTGESSRMDINAQLDQSGQFKKGLAFGGKGFASFDGQFDGNYARGLWRDERNCSGVWAAIKSSS